MEKYTVKEPIVATKENIVLAHPDKALLKVPDSPTTWICPQCKTVHPSFHKRCFICNPKVSKMPPYTKKDLDMIEKLGKFISLGNVQFTKITDNKFKASYNGLETIGEESPVKSLVALTRVFFGIGEIKHD